MRWVFSDPFIQSFLSSKISKVRTIYSEIRERMSSVEEKLVQYKLVVEHLLKNETSDGANYQVSTCSHLVWFGLVVWLQVPAF